jgi:hypothetical protein
MRVRRELRRGGAQTGTEFPLPVAPKTHVRDIFQRGSRIWTGISWNLVQTSLAPEHRDECSRTRTIGEPLDRCEAARGLVAYTKANWEPNSR